MRVFKSCGALALLLFLPGLAAAQQSDAAPPGSQANPSLVGGGLSRAYGTLLEGPYDVETYPLPPPGDNRCLGVEYLDSSYFVTGRGHTTLGQNLRIHRYDATNPEPSPLWYMGSWAQTTAAATGWGGRDMESNDSNLLWVGGDGSEVSEYGWDGANLTWIRYYYYPTVANTYRAFCESPTGPACSGGPPFWWTCSFSSNIFQCLKADPAGTVCASYTNPGIVAYGAAYDPDADTIQWWSQSGATTSEALEWDHMTQALTGRGFTSWMMTGPAGGADIYCDRFGNLAMVGLIQGAPDSIEVYEIVANSPLCGSGCNPVFYCTAKKSSSSCIPTMTTQGPAGANAGCPQTGANDYKVVAVNLEAGKPGIIFYGYAPAAIPFQGGYLCLQPPIKRTPPQSTGGTPPCGGVLGYAVNNPGDPPGTKVYYQAWTRDPMDPFGFGTSLSDAVELEFQP